MEFFVGRGQAVYSLSLFMKVLFHLSSRDAMDGICVSYSLHLQQPCEVG